MNKIVVIGGGASGLVAAINAKKKTNKVILLEKNNICGKKILATGNGKCNYWNSNQNLDKYHSNEQQLLKELITDDNNKEVLKFFTSLGIYPKIKNGYYYPYSNQATTIQNILNNECLRLGVEVKYNFNVTNVEKKSEKFIIYDNSKIIEADKLIIATGGCAAPKTGSTGDGYKFLQKFNHTIEKPLPALVQLRGKGKYLKEWAGIRTDAVVKLFENDKYIAEDIGEIQLTNYGISGICVFNLSYYVAQSIAKNNKINIKINFLPFINKISDLNNLLNKNYPIKEQLYGLLNNKLVNVIISNIKISINKPFQELSLKEQQLIYKQLTSFNIEIIGTNSFEEAQIVSGGVKLKEINLKTMESKMTPNLYVTGELLNINGDCGGYNLNIAWITGILAGRNSSRND